MIKLSEKLTKLASEFIDLDNELLVLAEETNDDEVLFNVSLALAKAAKAIQMAKDFVESKGGEVVTYEDLQVMAAIADEFDASGDPVLMKQAAVLDQVLLNFSKRTEKSAEDTELDRLHQKYRQQGMEKAYKTAPEEHDRDIQSADAADAINKRFKEYRPLEASLSTRYCPDHPGEMLYRVGEDVFQCALDKKMYNYKEGFTTQKGNAVPGGDVSQQTKSHVDRAIEQMSFSTRESAMGEKA